MAGTEEAEKNKQLQDGALPGAVTGRVCVREGQQHRDSFPQYVLDEWTTSSFEELFGSEEWQDITDRLLRKKILEPGCAPRPCWGEQVTVRMQAVVEDRTVVEKDSKLVFVIGEGDVSQALEEGVLSMQKGEVSLLLADSQYTYGHLGREPDIPSWAPLLYQLQLWDVQRKADPQSLPIAERIRIGNHKRERGNFYFQREEYNRAAQAYCMGLEITSAEADEIKDYRLKCLNNLAMVQLKLEQQEQALKTCREALQLDPQNVKALFRCGKVLKLSQGMELLKKALKLEPTTKVRKYSIFYKGHAHCSRSYGNNLLPIIYCHTAKLSVLLLLFSTYRCSCRIV
uniref:peptidylprolyl isomerase n=1 Tax=Neogobius melanostomus TaxID=47308 RepID=A0A8C6TIZ1_9GOBI